MLPPRRRFFPAARRAGLVLTVALALSARAQNDGIVVAVLAVEAPAGGVLSVEEADALSAELRRAASDALGASGAAVASDARDAAEALRDPLVSAVLSARAAPRLEGARSVQITLQLRSGRTATARAAGLGFAELKAGIAGPVLRLLREAKPAPAPGAAALLPAPASRPPAARSTPPPPAPAPSSRATVSGPSPLSDDAGDSGDPALALVREVAAEVEELRGLRRKSPLRVQILDDPGFRAAVREKAQKELTPEAVARERALWLAFDLAPPSADPAALLLSVLDEQVAGFYDPFDKTLVVRRNPPASAGAAGPDGLRLVLAHEIEHALQDQNFGLPDPSSLPDDDARFARAALAEGDAMMVMTAYGARRAGRPIRPAIAAAAASLRALSTDQILQLSGHSPALAAAPRVVREELALPYTAGFALVAGIYRRGGFPLVDKAFAAPPSSSHQILHPEVYFAGEKPAEVPAPAAPAGTQLVATGRLGELGAQLALEACVDPGVVRSLAPRWNGDAYALARTAEGALVVAWSSVWSGSGAAEAARLLRMQAPCWEDQVKQARGVPGAAIGAIARVGHGATRAALVRGGSPELQLSTLQLLLGARIPLPPPSAPFAAPAPPEVAKASVKDGKASIPRLGLSATIPAAWVADTSLPSTDFAVRLPGQGTAALLFVAERLEPDDAKGALLEAIATQAAAGLGIAGAARSAFSDERFSLAGAPARQRSWAVEGTPWTLRVAAIPACQNRAALALVRLEGSPSAQATLRKFAASIRREAEPLACSELE